MSVLFTDAGSGSGIQWSSPTAMQALSRKTIKFDYFPNTLNQPYRFWGLFDGTGTDSDECLLIYQTGSSAPYKKIYILAHFSTTNGVWTSTNDVLTIGARNSIIFTYDSSLAANNPLLYINGVSKSLTRTTAPVGSYRTGNGTYFYCGEVDAKIKDVRYYDIIKTPKQAEAISNEDIETNTTIDESNLVFHAPLTMCKGLTYPTYQGSVLSAGNEFFDRINGYVGVPYSSPVGA